MNSATSPLPVLEPLTLRDLIAAHTAELHAARVDMYALRRALDAAKFTPGRQVSDTALIIYANRLADFEQETLRVAGLMRQAARVQTWMELSEEEEAAELVPEPAAAPRSHRKRKPREDRHLRLEHGAGGIVLPGIAAAWAKGAVKHTLKVKPLAAAGVMGLTALSLGSSHMLPYDTPFVASPPHSATAPSAAPRIPASKLTSDTGPQPALRVHEARIWHPPVVVVPPLPAPVPAPAPVVTSSPQPQDSYQGSGQSQSSTWSQSSQPSESSRSPDYDAKGRHASLWSPAGKSGYNGRHAGISLDGISLDGNGQNGSGQNGSGHGAIWQGAQQQAAIWQGNGGQGIGQQGGNWQGGQQQGGGWQGNGGGHGNRGGH